MSELDLQRMMESKGVSPLRMNLAKWVESPMVQRVVVGAIVLNAIVLGLETSAALMERWGGLLVAIDRACLSLFIGELLIKLFCYRLLFWRNGWNVFDFAVVAIAIIPGVGPWAVLRSLRVLRVFRLLTAVPAMRRVVAAFLHSIPGLGGVLAVMLIFFYVSGVLATNLFGGSHPEWFGSLGKSLYSLFQVMTLESWSMGLVRPIMETHPWAWVFFVPFIVIATFTILNLFIGIIVSTMQELSAAPVPATHDASPKEQAAILARIETDLASLRRLTAGKP
jgi:voltage-gated sodium channel